MDQTLSYIKQNINQLIKNSDTSLFIQVQACIVPKNEKVPSMFTIPQESPPLPNSTTSTITMASESESASTSSGK
uniref:Uncharacterized protein n=1 Tax=Panagrolaimus davidi TaxID=227884 RepID=A0A914QW35_9BILA